MSRITLAGTPQSLYRLQERDLPSDHDLTYSHFYYVDADGFDLTGFNCDWMDWAHCSARGVAIPEGAPRLYSYKTDWTGAPLPRDFHSLNRDFLIEALKQQAIASTTADSNNLLAGVAHVTDHMGGSWKTIVNDLEGQGYAPADTMRVGMAAFANYPHALHRWDEEHKNRNWRDSPYEVVSPFLNICSPDGGRIHISNTQWPDKLKGLWWLRDRWAIAREIEEYLKDSIPRGAPWKAIVRNFEPVPVMEVEPTFPGEA